jgi:tetratricopeptide (TPR) repeat protein
MTRLRQVIQEIHRRSLWQVLGIYVIGGWIALQIVDTLAGALKLPDWAAPLALMLLIIGLPIVLATAFVQEGMGRESTQARAEPKPVPAGEAAAQVEAGAAASEPIQSARGPPAAELGDRARHKIFTWRNALLGGVVGLALLGVLTIGYMVTRTLGVGPAATLVARGVLKERGTIVLAEFDSRTGDTLLARAATEAFRIDLSQSDVVKVAEQAFLAEALRRMEQDPDSELDVELARELAEREGLPAVVMGDINSAGSAFVLSARLVAAETGEELSAFRATAKDSSEIVPAIDELSNKLRERIGDSYKVLRADEPLERVTTANLRALRKYSQAVRALDSQGDVPRGLSLLEEAVALDPEFAMAWRKLGVQLSNQFENRKRVVEALTKAFDHRDRLTERERYLTMAAYYSTVTGEPDRAMMAYQNILDLNPEDTWALNNLAISYGVLRDFERSLELYNRAIAIDSSASLLQHNAIATLTALGRLDEAEGARQVYARRFPRDPTNYLLSAGLALVQGDYEEVEAVFKGAAEDTRGIPALQAGMEFGVYWVLTMRGRLREARDHLISWMALQEERGVQTARLDREIAEASVDLAVRQDTSAALARLDAALELNPLSEISPLNRPYFFLATSYAAAGDPQRAGELWAEYQTAVPPQMRGDDEVQRYTVSGVIAYAEGRYEEAVEELRRSDVGMCVTCSLRGLAMAHEAVGQPDSALATFERYVAATSYQVRMFTDPTNLAAILERLGQLYDERGDWERAAEYYGTFVELWKHADTELRPRVEAAQARLDELFAAQG